MKAIINGVLILPGACVQNKVLLYDDKICAIKDRKEVFLDSCEEIIDAEGCFVAPGFINEHIHGCAGYDTMDEEEIALKAIRRALPQTGVTSFLPTTMTYDRPRIERALARIARQQGDSGGARILGAHMEGPFINAAYKGAQAAENISVPDFSWLEPYADTLRLITLAPEMAGRGDFFQQCADHHIPLSIGHSAASYEEALEAVNQYGMGQVTHLFNAMTPFHHRNPGIVGAALDLKQVRCELICDNLHVHPMLQRMVYHIKGAGGIILISDSMRACLQGDGLSELGGQSVWVKDGSARLADGTLAGSVLTMDGAVRNFWKNTGAPLREVIAMAAENPARALGVFDTVGSLEAGKAADIVIFDKNIQIRHTIGLGRTTYCRA